MEKLGTWVFIGLIVVFLAVGFILGRPGEEGRILSGMEYEEEDEEVCQGGPGELKFSGEPESDNIEVLKRVVTGNAPPAQAALSAWRTVNVFSSVQAQEAAWNRAGEQYVVRLVGPTPMDDDATVCLYETG